MNVSTQRIGPVVLQLRWEVRPDQDAEFNRWYDEEHLTDMAVVPGILGARRFVRVEGVPYATDTDYGYITIYQVESEAVFATPEYLELGRNPSEWTRKVAFDLGIQREVLLVEFPEEGALPVTDQPGPGSAAIGGALLHITLDVDRTHLDEVRRWHTEEHMPDIAGTSGVLSARRFVVPDADAAGDTTRLVVLYELEGVDAATSAEMMAAAQQTPWRQKLDGTFRSTTQLYRQIYPAAGALEL